MSTLSDRLKEIRTTAAKSQEEFAAIAGVTKRAQVNYENGTRSPKGTYLGALRQAGYDVGYIVTGFRNSDVPGGEEHIQHRNGMKKSARTLMDERGLPEVTEVFESLVLLLSTEGVSHNVAVYVADAFKALNGSVSAEGRTLLDYFNRADKRGKAAILTTARALSNSE